MEPSHLGETGRCRQVGGILSRIGDKWSVLVIMQLSMTPRRFGELKREIGAVSQKMLSATLRGLERDGFVSRTVYPTSPPTVEYALTGLGLELAKPVLAIGQWALDNADRIEAARARFDQAAELR